LPFSTFRYLRSAEPFGGQYWPLPYALVIHDSMFASSPAASGRSVPDGLRDREEGELPRHVPGELRRIGSNRRDRMIASPMYAAVASSPAAESSSCRR